MASLEYRQHEPLLPPDGLAASADANLDNLADISKVRGKDSGARRQSFFPFLIWVVDSSSLDLILMR